MKAITIPPKVVKVCKRNVTNYSSMTSGWVSNSTVPALAQYLPFFVLCIQSGSTDAFLAIYNYILQPQQNCSSWKAADNHKNTDCSTMIELFHILSMHVFYACKYI